MSVTNTLIAKIISLTVAAAPVSEYPVCKKTCDISNDGLAIIRTFEGYSPFPYKDSAGLPTIGYGHLILKGEKFNGPLLPEMANLLLLKDTAFAVKAVNRWMGIGLKQNQADAVISLTYNIGGGAFSKSTLLKKMNLNKHDEVPAEFMKWDYAGGKKIKGLTNRRAAEAALYKQ